MSRFCPSTVVWLADTDRERLAEIALRFDAPSGRVGGRMLAKALLTYTPGEFEQQPKPKVELNRAGKPAKQRLVPRSNKQ
ncbi:hypothetical protein [Paraburkholderia susongensis]|uniref:Uncharacterized protein n=1 Tax=Paraburkholderia susongensis TaxID=1515439 RepID=A0A1X7II22_9BURK|nr:hypothetical protein [Paraburkholderia susongensis]SMG13995.1 hypothetical protein SAMN06265784_101686 [Paraburkholderia susongensis]